MNLGIIFGFSFHLLLLLLPLLRSFLLFIFFLLLSFLYCIFVHFLCWYFSHSLLTGMKFLGPSIKRFRLTKNDGIKSKTRIAQQITNKYIQIFVSPFIFAIEKRLLDGRAACCAYNSNKMFANMWPCVCVWTFWHFVISFSKLYPIYVCYAITYKQLRFACHTLGDRERGMKITHGNGLK